MVKFSRALFVVLTLVLLTSNGQAKDDQNTDPLNPNQDFSTGVSLEAISLPSKAATISGLGKVVANKKGTGTFQYQIPIEIPVGINQFKPNVALTYDSGAGNNEFGQGWTLSSYQMIERSSLRGVPRYDEDDLLWGPHGELVELQESTASLRIFAPFNNESQSVYEFDVAANVWTLKSGSGETQIFGGSNRLVGESSEVSKWLLHKRIDTYGNEIIYDYISDQGKFYLSKISYAYRNGNPFHEVSFDYEDRVDVKTSYKTSHSIVTTKRLATIWVKSNTQVIRRYELTYTSNPHTHVSLLTKVQMFGKGTSSSVAMPAMSFEYSANDYSEAPVTRRMEFLDAAHLPSNMKQGRTTFIDLNRDGLSDILRTSRTGARVWLNNGEDGFSESYELAELLSILGTENAKLLDVDGDRIVDLVGTGLYPKYFKGGIKNESGEFGFDPDPISIHALPEYSINAKNVKTLDLNGDGRLDILAREPDHFKSFVSSASGSWDRAQDLDINTQAFNLGSPYSFFGDMNGDGLTDLVFMGLDHVFFLAAKGDGSFSAPAVMEHENNDRLIIELALSSKYKFVSDVNGDGLSDLMVTGPDSVSFALNRGDGSFSEIRRFFNIHNSAEGPFDVRGLNISMADLNGNGTSDLVWMNEFYDYRYLDLGEVKANLLTTVKNGLGLTTNLTYERGVVFGQDATSLETDLAAPMTVLTSLTQFHGSNQNYSKKSEFRYYGGYYDGLENEFRGFNLVDVIEFGDSTIDSLITRNYQLQARPNENVHLKFKVHKKNQYQINTNDYSLGELLSAFENTWSVEETFNSLTERTVGFSYISNRITTQGDEDPLTTARTFKTTQALTFDGDGFVKTRTVDLYLDEINLLRSEASEYAAGNMKNRLCKKEIYGVSNNLLSSDYFYYDNQTLCSLGSFGSVTSIEKWNGVSYESKGTYTYHGFGPVASFTDPQSNTTQISYEVNNIYPSSLTDGAGNTQSVVNDMVLGKITSSTDVNRNVSSYEYDDLLRLSKIVGPADTSTLFTKSYSYIFGDSSGTPSVVVELSRIKSGQSDVLEKRMFFDSEGRELGSTMEADGTNFIFSGGIQYNVRGQKSSEFLPYFVTGLAYPGIDSLKPKRSYEYDLLARVLKDFNPEHTSGAPSFKESVYLVGQTLKTNENGHTLTEYIDTRGRRTKVKDALGTEVLYEFDARDLMVKITDPKGSLTLFKYDPQGKRICKLDPTVGVTLYHYNAGDLLTSRDDFGFVSGHSTCDAPSGVTARSVTYEYNDGNNRQTKIDFPVSSNTDDVVYSYDSALVTNGKGQLTGVSKGSLSKSFEYDLFGNIAKKHITIDGTTYVTEEKYNVIGSIDQVVYPTIGSRSLTLNHSYDDGNRLVGVKNGASYNYTSGATYNPLGSLTQLQFGNGVQTDLTYDDVDNSFRLTNISTTGPGSIKSVFKKMIFNPFDLVKSGTVGILSNPLQNIDYEYDPASNITMRDDILHTVQEDYSYDVLERLTSADIGLAETRSWNYDEMGNILSRSTDHPSSVTTSYSYDTNRPLVLATEGAHSYVFDDFGNITSGKGRTYVFNWFNRPTSITTNGGSTTATYYYDEEGIRYKKVVGSTTTLFIDKYTEVKNGAVIYHLFHDERRVAAIDGNTATTFNHPDHLGSSNLRTDSSGVQLKRIEYYPYGSKRENIGSYNEIHHNYTGQYEDQETELYYYKARYYDPELGRFISADPLYLEEMDKRGVDALELNIFLYVKDSPTSYVDPDGKNKQHAQFIGYMRAGIVDLAHFAKYQAKRFQQVALGVGDSRVTGLGGKASFNGWGALKFSARLGYGYSGATAFGELRYDVGKMKGVGQFGYRNGKMHLIARGEGHKGVLSGGVTRGTTNDIRGKFGYKGFEIMYNSNMSGRIDVPLGSYRDVNAGAYADFNLTEDSIQHFEQAEVYDDHSTSGSPYGGAAF
jgi:RHS repeat-associated protein